MSALLNVLQQLLAIIRGSPSTSRRNSTVKTKQKMPATGAGDLVGLAEALLESVKAMQANPQDQELRIGVAKLAKRVGSEAAGPESIIPMYAVAVSPDNKQIPPHFHALFLYMLITICRVVAQFGEIGATYQFMEWKLFDKIPKEKSISYQELADSVGADVSVVSKCIIWIPRFTR